MFLSYFITAVQTIHPGVGQETQALLTAPSLPPPPLLARTLINELSQIDTPFVFGAG
jgi:ATP/maltotriose-dependent transcriptional regulator MalT